MYEQARIELFRGKSGLLKIAPAWRKLTSELGAKRHFHCVEWYLALADTLEKFGENKLFFFAVFVSDELLAVLPFRGMTIRLAGVQLRAMQLFSDAWEAETARDIVMQDSAIQSDMFARCIGFLDKADPSWDVISLRGVLDDSFAVTALKRNHNLPVLSAPGGAWGHIEFISCGADDRPFARLSKGFRQNLRTAHNKLKSKDPRFITARNPAELIAAYPEFLSVESSGWKGEQGSSALKQPIVDSFLRNSILYFGPIDGCEIHLMQLERQTIAALFCIVFDDVCYILKTSYNEAFGNISPGHLILENVLMQRGGSGTLKVMTPYNAPPWFSAWKPDQILQIWNFYVFRPSQQGVELRRRIIERESFTDASAATKPN